jgi:hypothetical protein
MSIPLTASVTKDPDANLDYQMDWSNWLESGDSLTTTQWLVSGPDAILKVAASPAPEVDGPISRCWLEDGTAGARYKLTCRIETLAGRVDDRTVLVIVRER